MISLGLFALSSNPFVTLVTIFVAGLLMGGIFSLGLLTVNEGIPGLEDKTTSILIATGGLGGAFIPRIVGSLLDDYSVNFTLWIMFFISLFLSIIMGLVFLYRTKLFYIYENIRSS